MVRTTATNFSGGLQFPYATAAADIFKKEDIQTLALAVDQHTHGVGKGLPVAPLTAGQIPNGLITSAMIADGTITGTDIAVGAIGSAQIADGSIVGGDIGFATISPSAIIADQLAAVSRANGTTSAPTTTSGTMAVIPEMTVSFTIVNRSLILVMLTGTFNATVAGDCLFQADVQGTGSAVTLYQGRNNASLTNQLFSVVAVNSIVQAAGTYTARGLWAVQGGGTLQAQTVNRELTVIRVALGG